MGGARCAYAISGRKHREVDEGNPTLWHDTWTYVQLTLRCSGDDALKNGAHGQLPKIAIARVRSFLSRGRDNEIGHLWCMQQKYCMYCNTCRYYSPTSKSKSSRPGTIGCQIVRRSHCADEGTSRFHGALCLQDHDQKPGSQCPAARLEAHGFGSQDRAQVRRGFASSGTGPSETLPSSA
jgi:hypothetical protein